MPSVKIFKYFIYCVAHSLYSRNHFKDDCDKLTDEELRGIIFALFIAIIFEMIALLLLMAISLKTNGSTTTETVH